jgi:hypothetical protein
VLPTDPEAKQKIVKFLAVQKSYPSFTVGTLDSKLAFPTEIVDGQANTDIQTVAKFLFAGDAPLIGTNINSEVPFINSYFQFKVGPNGLNIVTKEEVEEDGPYMDDLDATFGEAPKPSDFGEAETIGELTDEGEIKPVTDTKTNEQKIADLRAKEQAEYNAIDPNDAVEKEKIYGKYDKLITPLINEVKADIEKRRQEELSNQTKDATNIRNSKTKEELDKFLMKVFQEETLIKALNTAGMMLGKDITGKYYNKDYSFKIEVADAIEDTQKNQIVKINAKYDAELAVLEGKPTETKPVTVELNKEVEENDKVCQVNNPKDAGKPATLGNKKFKDSDDSDWD